MKKNPRSADAIALLKADHRQVAKWFAEFDKARNGNRKEKLAAQICRALRVHAQIEEEIFYPAFIAATGDKGVIYKITPGGNGTVFYKTNTTNVVTLAVDKAGNLIAGTESPGRIFRIDKAAKAFVLVDSPFKEIHALKIAAALLDGGGGDGHAVPSLTRS